MLYKETHQANLFKELAMLAINSDYPQLDDNNITAACFGAINEMEDKQCISDVIFKMSMTLQTITKVINELVTRTKKADKARMCPNNIDKDYYNIPNLAEEYHISGQAIRKACKEGRLNFKQGKGKNKYLIKKSDFETYMLSAKGKKHKSDLSLLSTAA